MADRNKQRRISAAPPPRTLNVQKFAESRAAEIESLHSIVANRSNNDFRSRRNKRRRTTSHNNRVAKNRYGKQRKLTGVVLGDGLAPDKGEGEMVPRRIRRRIELKKNPESGYSTSGDGTRRLRTHVWHAKRFTMTKQWGFHLPLVLHGRGRGSRALLKRFKDGVLIHDASYHGAIQLEGPESSLLQMLSTVLVSSQPSNYENISHSVLSGAIYGSAMLHHSGAPFSPAVAPVTYMWRPFQRQDVAVADYRSADGYNGPQGMEGSSFRQLLIWIHASAFNEAYDELKLACQKQMDATGSSINCISLQGKLAKLEIMGSKSFQLLQKILHPVTSIAENSGVLHKCSHMDLDAKSHCKNISIFENQHHPPSSVISLTVTDPRSLFNEKVELVPKVDFTSNLGNMSEDVGEKLGASGGIPSDNAELLSSSLLEHEEGSSLSNSMDLWDASKGILPPVEDNVLCMAKHQRQLDYFCIRSTNFGKQNASIRELLRQCPILLVNDSNKNGSSIRWSIILPLNWVKVFWVPLVLGGAHAIGLTEKHWIACEVGLPYFPSGFPDCSAYSSFMATKAAAFDEKLKLRPPGMRPVRIPIPPPWESVRFSLGEESSGVEDDKTLSEEHCSINAVEEDTFKKSYCRTSDATALGHHGFITDIFAARTSNMLRHFLGEIHGDHFLLFPESDVPDLTNSIDKVMKDNERLSRTPKEATTVSNSGRRLCFLRVILHAYKSGVFEEGAVVCAPRNSDIKSWMSRSSNNSEQFQIPQSSVGSYFEQQPSGKWELQIPKDPIAKELHRWPIGFVTSGFVRGSKKPSGEAVCEATLLAGLREEQWNAMPVKGRRKEIYVLVRNLRSTAYRLALATIVLEQNTEDLAFM